MAYETNHSQPSILSRHQLHNGGSMFYPDALHVSCTSPSKSLTSKCLGSIIIRLCVTETTTSIALLCNNRPSAQSALETATGRRAISIGSTLAGDELGALSGNMKSNFGFVSNCQKIDGRDTYGSE